jgi:cytoskeletal protein RodZ
MNNKVIISGVLGIILVIALVAGIIVKNMSKDDGPTGTIPERQSTSYTSTVSEVGSATLSSSSETGSITSAGETGNSDGTKAAETTTAVANTEDNQETVKGTSASSAVTAKNSTASASKPSTTVTTTVKTTSKINTGGLTVNTGTGEDTINWNDIH